MSLWHSMCLATLAALLAHLACGQPAESNPGAAQLASQACMDLEGLKRAVDAAVWKPEPGQPGRQAIILTSCDHFCLERFFHTWINAIRYAEGGDMSPHIIVAAIGVTAFKQCERLQRHYMHQCVLDHACGYPESLRSERVLHPTAAATHDQAQHLVWFGSAPYRIALANKLIWAREVQALNTTVVWLDMDIVVYKSLLPRLLSGPLADADFAIQDETCNSVFKNMSLEAVKWPVGTHWSTNGGLWVASPTLAGRQLLDVWTAGYIATLADGFSVRKLDQAVISVLLESNLTSKPGVRMLDNGAFQALKHENGTDVLWTWPLDMNVYYLNQLWYNSQCYGLCGCLRPFQRTPEYKALHPSVCGVPQEDVDRWVTMHMNCKGDPNEKKNIMVKVLHRQGMGSKPASTKIHVA